MKLFEVQTNLISYTYSIIKIILSISIILVCIFRRKIICFSGGMYNILVSIICFVLTLFCILILYISIGELFHTRSNRKQPIGNLNDVVQIPVEEVIRVTNRDDIVEIEIATNEGIVKIGTSSDNVFYESAFTGKKFYIGLHEFESPESFANKLFHLSKNGFLDVLTIDGIHAQKLKSDRGHRDGLREP